MRESQFWALIKNKLPGHVERIENAIAKGTPDVNMCINGREVWIELKVLDEKGRFKKGEPSPEQRLWHRKRQENGGTVFVLSRNDSLLKLSQVQRDMELFDIWACSKPFQWDVMHDLMGSIPPFVKEQHVICLGEKQ